MAQTTPNHNTVVGVFDDARMAQGAVEELRRVGFRDDQIGVVTRAVRGENGATITEGTGSHWEEGAAIGAAAGAGAGAGGSAFTGNKEIVLPAESDVAFELTQVLKLERK